ncbi:MAG: ABC transporter ATP-binding protein [Desulfobacteraceae bacterium]|jgi:iron complex transport system ATP-binding protein
MDFVLDWVSFSYPGKKVLSELNLSLKANRFIGIIGPNGCGKTTLLDLLMRHHKPQKGHISYADKPLNRYSKKELARYIALVPQNYSINFPFSAKEVVMMGRYPHIPRFAAPSLKDHNKVNEIMTLTDCIELGHRPVTELSGGERQRVVFARALAQNPKVLILDEATANMDIHHSLRLLQLVSQLQQENKMGVVAVFQDINLAAKYCQELIFMSKGKVVAIGPTDKVLKSDILLKVFQVDAKVYFEEYNQSHQVVFRQ